MRGMHDEAEIRRDDDRLAEEDATRRTDDGGAGAERRACITKTLGAYPAAAGRFFAVQAVRMGGVEQEGSPATETPVGATFFAFNLGTQIPGLGQKVEVSYQPDRWVFTYGPPAPIPT